MQYNNDDVLRLIGLAYGSIEGPAGWTPFFEAMSEISGMNTIALAYAGPADYFNLNLVHGMDMAHMLEFGEVIARQDPFRQPAIDRPPGQFVEPAVNLLDRSRYVRTEHYDFVTRVGSDDLVLAIDKSAEHDIVSFVGLTPRGVRTDVTHVAFMKTVAPHVFQAVALSRQFARLETRYEASREALARADFGCIFLNEVAEVEWVNDFGRRLLESNDAIELNGRHLNVRHAPSRARFERAVQVGLNMADGEFEAVDPILEIERLDEGRSLEVLISPLQPLSNALVGPAGGVMVLLADPEYVDERLGDRLASLYGLTPTEAEIAQWILSGSSINRIAEIFGNSVHTVRTHVKRLMKKCQVTSQPQLVGVLQRSLARLA